MLLGKRESRSSGSLPRGLRARLQEEAVANPLASYPDRGWERTYRDLWKYDSVYTFTCAPNDTHNCILNAYVRNGVVVRIGPSMKYGEATDLLGNKASHRWDPRVCQKGLALTRSCSYTGSHRRQGRQRSRTSDRSRRAAIKRWSRSRP